MNMPKISVIVPVYKAESYLPLCVDSILSQSFADWELLLVDDGSPDRSGYICDEYSKIDSRIRVIHKDNGGVSSARNVGIEKSSGEWLYFIDSDDYIDNPTLQTIIEKASTCNPDIIVHGLVNEYVDKKETDIIKYELIDEMDYKSIIEYTDRCGLLKGPVCKLFKRELIDGYSIRFDESICYGEDTKFTFEYLHFCHSICFVSEHYYHYCFRNIESLTKRDYPYKFWDKAARMLLELRKPIMKQFNMPDSYWQYIRFEYISHLSRAIYSMYDSGIRYKERINYLLRLRRDPVLKMTNINLSYLNRLIYLIKSPHLMDVIMVMSIKFKKRIF